MFGGEEYVETGQKRKASTNILKPVLKRPKNSDKENKESATKNSNSADLDHTKIVTEFLKKYPNLVKKNKNIKLKIMPVSSTTPSKKVVLEKPLPEFSEIQTKVTKVSKYVFNCIRLFLTSNPHQKHY